MNRKIKTNQEGFFSIEAMGSGFYWLVGMILSFSAVGVLYALSSSNQEIQNTNQLLQVTRHLKSSQGYKSGDLIPDLIKLEVIPVNVTIKNNKLSNSYGGEIEIKGDDTGYTLTTKKIPQSDCIKLSTNISRGSFIYRTKINNKNTNGEVDSATAARHCINENIIKFSTRS